MRDASALYRVRLGRLTPWKKNSRLAVQPGTVQPRTFQHILPAAATSTQGSPSAAAASNDGGKLDADDDQFPYLTAFAAKLHKTPPKATWTADLALMHHFTASAWKTLPRSGSIPQIWQVIVPQIAVEYDFLMHQILAISAFHLAALHAEQHQSYWLRATYHQNEAIQLFRQQIATIDEQNCHAVFMTASLLCLSVFGSSSARVASQSCPSLDDLLAVFLLIRGMNGILKAWEGHIHKGILSGMLQLTNRDGGTPLLKSIERQLRDLNFAADDQSQGSNTHREGVDTLLEWIVHASAWADEPESRICTTWPFSLSNQFMHCLTCRDPAALKVLLIYCRILESAGDNYWYMEGWGAGVTRDIKRCQERIGT